MNVRQASPRFALPAREKGVVLFIALIVLIVMSLVGISMIRQGSSSQMIVGNLAFKEGAEAAADFGVESARSWLLGRSGEELKTSVSPRYFANGLTASFNPSTDISFAVTSSDLGALKYEAFYVIHRLCDKVGPVTAVDNLCILYSETSSKEGIDYANPSVAGFMPYYRVTVRVTGPRGTTSYVQALLY